MGDTLHTYHPTSKAGLGIHALTTTDFDEARAMFHATTLRAALADVLSRSNQILELIEQTKGRAALYRDVANSIYHAERALGAATTGGFKHD